MNPIAIFCDSTGGFTAEERARLGVRVLPLSIQFSDGRTLVEGTRDTYPAYYDTLPTLQALPTTSQPAIGLVCEAFSEALAAGCDVIAICLSEGLSGTFGSFSAAAAMAGPERIRVVDCRCCSVGVKFLARIARGLIDAGMALDPLADALREAAGRIGAVMFVDDLKYLKKGGRLSTISFFAGKLLHVRPILKMQDGFLVAHDKVRGMRVALERLIQEVPDRLRYLTVLHCANLAGARACMEKLRARFAGIAIELEDLSPVIGTHLGNGSVGIIYCEEGAVG